MGKKEETVAALCTAPGGALAILRISGPDALPVAQRLWHGKQILSAGNARKMLLGKAGGPDGEPCLAVYMPGPHSYTGEDVAELHCHGGAFAPKRLLEAAFAAGAVPAGPGEFTKRAFLNGKMDLTQAEAVADLIGAKSDRAARLAQKQLDGKLGQTIRHLREPLISLLAEFESRLDFSEEDLDWATPEQCLKRLAEIEQSLHQLLKTEGTGILLRDGIYVAIAGRPNAGKSSLLNTLLGYNRAIVTEIPGTTRDTLEEYVSLRNIPVHLTDTAGLREDASDPVEKIGIQRSLDTVKLAKIVFWVLDAADAGTAMDSAAYLREHLPENQEVIGIWNKIDLPHTPTELPMLPDTVKTVRISVQTGEGMDTLLDLFEKEVWQRMDADESAAECEISARHGTLLRDALQTLQQAEAQIRLEAWELAALELRQTIRALDDITGEEIAPDVLDEIFSRFCIGK